jgi:hypothetical protein
MTGDKDAAFLEVLNVTRKTSALAMGQVFLPNEWVIGRTSSS